MAFTKPKQLKKVRSLNELLIFLPRKKIHSPNGRSDVTMLFLLFIGVCLWITGIIIAIACGLPLLALVAKFAIEMFVGYKIFCAIKRKREQRQHDINQFKGLM